MTDLFARLQRCTNMRCRLQGKCLIFTAETPLPKDATPEGVWCVCGCTADRHYAWDDENTETAPDTGSRRQSFPPSSNKPTASKSCPRQSYPTPSTTSVRVSSDDEGAGGSATNLFADVRQNVKRRQQDGLRSHLRVDPGAKIYEGKAEKMSMTRLLTRNTRKSMRGQTRTKNNKKSKDDEIDVPPSKKAKLAETVVEKSLVFRIVMIPETSAVDKGTRNVPSDEEVKTKLTLAGLVGYVTLAMKYTVEEMRRMIVEDLRDRISKKRDEGSSTLDLSDLEHFSLLSGKSQGRGKASRLVRVYNSEKDSIIFSMYEDYSRRYNKTTPTVFIARLQGLEDIREEDTTDDGGADAEGDGKTSDADDFDFPDIDWPHPNPGFSTKASPTYNFTDWVRLSPDPSIHKSPTPVPMVETDDETDLDAEEAEVSTNLDHLVHHVVDLGKYTRNIEVDEDSNWHRWVAIGQYANPAATIKDIEESLSQFPSPTDLFTSVPSSVVKQLRLDLMKLQDDLHFMRVMGTASLQGHNDNFMDNLRRGFRLGPGGLTPIWETIVKTAKILEAQAKHHTENYLTICRCLWHIDQLSLHLIPPVKAFRLEVPRWEWDVWGIRHLREAWHSHRDWFPVARFEYHTIGTVDVQYIEYISKASILTSLQLDFGYDPKSKDITKDVLAGENGIDGLLEKLQSLVDEGNKEREAYKTRVATIKDFCYVLSTKIPGLAEVSKKKREDEEEKRRAEEERKAKSQKKSYPKPKLRVHKSLNPIIRQPITHANVDEHLSNAQLDRDYTVEALLETVMTCFPHPIEESRNRCVRASKASRNKKKKELIAVYHPDKNVPKPMPDNWKSENDPWIKVCTEISKHVNALPEAAGV